MASKACLAFDDRVREAVEKLIAAGCDLERGEGTVVARDGDVVVYRALRKGARGQPWIVLFRDSDRIHWNAIEHQPGS